MRPPKDYAFYKGEKLLCVGTVKEIAEEMEIQESTVRFYGTQAYRKRLDDFKNPHNARILIKLEDDDIE